MSYENQSEYAVKPKHMLVHDPFEFGVFRDTSSLSNEELLQTVLFREHPDVEAMHQQHQELVTALRRHVDVKYLKDVLGPDKLSELRGFLQHDPNFVFMHDALVTIPWLPNVCIISNMRKPMRQKEPFVLRHVARILGLEEITTLPADCYLEGGDVMPFCHDGRRMLLVGFGPRTARETLTYLSSELITGGHVDEIIGFQLAEWRLNIDGCFFPLSDELAVAQLDSIIGGVRIDSKSEKDTQPVDLFREWGFEIVQASIEESYNLQACNFACLGEETFVAYNMTERINEVARAKGLKVVSVGGTELVKGNGGPHCMTRPIYRDI